MEESSGDSRPKSGHQSSKGSGPCGKLEQERLIRALWPTQETQKEFMEITGVAIDAHRLLSSVSFRDSWMIFNKKKVPTGKERNAIRKLAIETHSRRTGPTPQRGTREIGRKTKRADLTASSVGSPFHTPSSTPTQDRKLPKIPKLVGTAKEPSNTPIESSDHQEGDYIDRDDLPTLETFTQDLQIELPETFAEATKGGTKRKRKRARVENPYVLYMHTGDEERRAMSKETWSTFLTKLQSIVVDLSIAGKETPRVEWSGFADGVGLLAPRDVVSRDLLKDIVQSIEVAEFKFRGWTRTEEGKFTSLQMRIPPSMSHLTSGKLLTSITKINGLPEGSALARGYKSVPRSKEKVLRIGAEKPFVEALVALKGEVYVGVSKLVVYAGRNPLYEADE